MLNPSLEGYGGAPLAAETELRSRLGEYDFLVDLFQLGQEMQSFVETPAGAYLFAELKQQFNGSLSALLEEADLTSLEARQSFADMRAAWAALGRIDTSLRAARQADKMISEMDQQETER